MSEPEPPNPYAVTIEPGFQTVFKLRAVPKATVSLTPPAATRLDGRETSLTLEGQAENLDGEIPCRLTVLVRGEHGFRRVPYAGLDSFSVSGEAFSLDLKLDVFKMHLFGRGKVGFELTPQFPHCKPAVLEPVLEFDNVLDVSLTSGAGDMMIGTTVSLCLDAEGAFQDAHIRMKLYEFDGGEQANADGFTREMRWPPSDRETKRWRIGCSNAEGPAEFEYQDNERDDTHEFGYVLEASPDGEAWSKVKQVDDLVKVARPRLERFELQEREANMSLNYVSSWLGNVFLRSDDNDKRMVQIWVSGQISHMAPELEVPLTVALFARKQDGSVVPFRDKRMTFTVKNDHAFEFEMCDFTDLSYGEDLSELQHESGVQLFAAIHSHGLSECDPFGSIVAADENLFRPMRPSDGTGRWANAVQTQQQPASAGPVSCGCWLSVPMGQVTFDAEGNDDSGSQYYSRTPHCPSSSSGVTIGRGYDMKARGRWRNKVFEAQPEKVEKALVWAGVDAQKAKDMSAGAGKKGNDASSFCSANSSFELTRLQQWKLFGLEFNRHLQDVKRICNGESCVDAYGAVDFSKLDWRLMVILVDLRYRGDYHSNSRPKLQPHVVKNDFEGFRSAFKANGDVVGQSAVPARHDARVKFLDDYQAYKTPEEIPASKRKCRFCNKSRGTFPTGWRTDGFDDTWKMSGDPPEGVLPWTPRTIVATPNPAGTVANMVDRGGEKVPHFNQADPAWASRTLGENRTIQSAGCAMSSVAMCLKFYGRDVTPATLDAYLDSNGGYSGDAIVWGVAWKHKESGSSFRFTHKDERDETKFDAILTDRIGKDMPTVAQVDYGSDANDSGDHWVVIIGKTSTGNYIMCDPGTRHGNGVADPAGNTLETTERHGGYNLVRILPFEVTQA